MMSRNKHVPLAAVLGLAVAALVGPVPTATAATPVCTTTVFAVDDTGRLLERQVTNNAVTHQRTTVNQVPFAVSSLIGFDAVTVNAGDVFHMQAIVPSGRPQNLTVRDYTAETDLTLTVANPSPYPNNFSPRSVTGSGRYYVYGIDDRGNLKRWTRFKSTGGQYFYEDVRIIATGMSGLRTLSYSNTYDVNGKATDFLYATTGTGRLKQIRVPWSSPTTETVKTLATSGFASTTGLSLSFCNDNGNYLSLIAIDKNAGTGRWYTFPNPYAATPTNLVDRGLVEPGQNWHLHATT